MNIFDELRKRIEELKPDEECCDSTEDYEYAMIRHGRYLKIVNQLESEFTKTNIAECGNTCGCGNVIERITERLKTVGWVFAEYFPDETAVHRVTKKSIPYDEVLSIIHEESEGCKPVKQEPSGWIPVESGQMPEEHIRILVELSNGWQVVATYDGEEWVLVWHYYMPIETDYIKVVKWRYLNTPYQKGE